ncbi:MAG: tryptophan 7-halogenase, partial [Actinomycetota bacterium]
MANEQPDFDVGIIGGGPAGSSMAGYLAMGGVNCVVFERELFPRPHVGESLVPSSTRVFKDLGFLPTMERERFPHKFGAVWTATGQNPELYQHDWNGLAADCQVDIRFEERDQPGVDQNYTYHVDRGKFDQLLLEHANGLGAKVYEGAGVRDVDFAATFPRIRYEAGEKEADATVRIVVDASGRRTLLGNRLKLKVMDRVF